jgi:hypothetical protein
VKALLLSTAIATFAVVGTASARPFALSRGQADRVTAGSDNFLSFGILSTVDPKAQIAPAVAVRPATVARPDETFRDAMTSAILAMSLR